MTDMAWEREAVLAMCLFASEKETKIGAPGYVRARVEVESVVEDLVREGFLERWTHDTDFVRPTDLGRAEVGKSRIQ